MINIKKMVDTLKSEDGYSDKNAVAHVCQDLILKAISKSSLSRNVTVKGGVVMRSVTKEVRRATRDLDLDFIRYSLSDESIDLFIRKINCIEGIEIKQIGKIEALSQQDYNGKRVMVQITDVYGYEITSKIDLGVHKHFDIEQEEYCFDVAYDEKGASLLINSLEQMFTEKLRSLLKFGVFSTRYKDVYDMYYCCDKLNLNKVMKCFDTYIFMDKGMRENNMEEIFKRVEKVFGNEDYKKHVETSDKKWLDDDINQIFSRIMDYIKDLRNKTTFI